MHNISVGGIVDVKNCWLIAIKLFGIISCDVGIGINYQVQMAINY